MSLRGKYFSSRLSRENDLQAVWPTFAARWREHDYREMLIFAYHANKHLFAFWHGGAMIDFPDACKMVWPAAIHFHEAMGRF